MTATERLRDQHRAALAAVKSLPLGVKRQALLVRCDALAREIRTIERAQAEK